MQKTTILYFSHRSVKSHGENVPVHFFRDPTVHLKILHLIFFKFCSISDNNGSQILNYLSDLFVVRPVIQQKPAVQKNKF